MPTMSLVLNPSILCSRTCSMPTGSGGAPKLVMSGTCTLLGYSSSSLVTYWKGGGSKLFVKGGMCACACV